MRSADVGDSSRNVIPTTATAALDLRLVLGNTPDRQVERVIAHIRAQGYEVMDRAPTIEERRRFPRIARVTREPGYPAERTPLDHPLAAVAVARAARATARWSSCPASAAACRSI